jgi:hypothetical protein
MTAAQKVADVSDRRAQRIGVTCDNMRAKRSNYIGQVFECKADHPHYSRTVVRAKREERDSREERDARFVQTLPPHVTSFPQVSPVSLEQGICTCNRHVMNNAG